MPTIRLPRLTIIVIPIISKSNATPTLPSRRIPAPRHIGSRTQPPTTEETVRAVRVLVCTGRRGDLGAVRVEEQVAVEVAEAAFAFAVCAAGVGERDACALEDELGVAGLVAWVAADQGVWSWDWGEGGCCAEGGDC